jgi:nucleotide-binding universal stress UspA family protein
MFKRILIATDGSALSKKAVSSGIDLARSLHAEVLAYTAVVRNYYANAELLSPDEIARIDKAAHDHAQVVVHSVREEALRHGLKVTTVVGHDPIAEGILATAQTHQCDLIVMASHGRKGLKRLLMGSETLDVLTHASIPVLVLK